jgi:hypothetical protein
MTSGARAQVRPARGVEHREGAFGWRDVFHVCQPGRLAGRRNALNVTIFRWPFAESRKAAVESGTRGLSQVPGDTGQRMGGPALSPRGAVWDL